jgi:hypothetical protein
MLTNFNTSIRIIKYRIDIESINKISNAVFLAFESANTNMVKGIINKNAIPVSFEIKDRK